MRLVAAHTAVLRRRDRTSRLRRGASTLLAGLFTGALWAAPGWSISVWMSDESGFDFHDGPYATNEVVYISGEWDQYDFPCPIGDVYMVPNTGAPWDATRGIGGHVAKKPVQGCAGAGAFYGAILELPPLPLGEFDIVMDENQDGIYQYGTDYVLGMGTSCAFRVIDHTLDQRVDVAGIKAKAAEEAHSWRVVAWGTRISMTCLSLATTAYTAANLLAVTGSRIVGFGYAAIAVGGMFKSYAMSYDGVDMMIYDKFFCQAGMQTASVHQAVADDPPDPAYTELVVLDPLAYVEEEASEPTLNLAIRLRNRAEEEGSVATGFRRSYEKFLGAEADASYGWARLHARAAGEYADLLVGRLSATAAVIDSLEAAGATAGWANKMWVADSARALQQRVAAQGFFPQELDSMQAAGLGAAEIDSLRNEITGTDLSGLETGSLGAWLDSLRAETVGATAYYESVSVHLSGVLEELQQSWIGHPLAAITGETVVEEGGMLGLSGAGSTDPDSLLLDLTWDLDADGSFDDGAGPEVAFARSASGEYRVGLRVVNSNGLWDVAYRFIRVTEVNRMPGFASTLPGPAYLRLAQGAVQVFSVSASDADGDPVVAHWFLDGGEVATGNDWSYATAAQDAGRHHVLVRLDDGSPLSPDNFYVWRVDVQTGADVIPESAVSRGFWLSPGEPNPFSSQATLRFSVERAGQVELGIYDARGRRVANLVAAYLEPGVYRVTWNGLLAGGGRAPQGIYFARLVAGERDATTRLTRIR